MATSVGLHLIALGKSAIALSGELALFVTFLDIAYPTLLSEFVSWKTDR